MCINSVPLEVLERIFVFSTNEKLCLVDKKFHAISKCDKTKAKWLFYRYGAKHAIGKCWKWKFMKRDKFSTKCRCVSDYDETTECALEIRQLQIISYLIQMQCRVDAGEGMALRMAANYGHLSLAEYLILHGSNPDPCHRRETWTKRLSKILQKPHNRRLLKTESFYTLSDRDSSQNTANRTSSLLLNAVRKDQKNLVRILLTDKQTLRMNSNVMRSAAIDTPKFTAEPESTPSISQDVLQSALKLSIKRENMEMFETIIQSTGISLSIADLRNLLTKANIYRFLIGSGKRYDIQIRLSIKALSDHDFDRFSSYIMKTCAEIGSIEGIKICKEKGGDVNAWDGLPLYASVYTGNLKTTKHLLSRDGGASVEYFRGNQVAFILSLLVVEVFGIVMFSLLLVMWIMSLIGMGRAGKTEDDSVSELAGLGIPSVLALFIMYRIVPFHRVLLALLEVQKAKRTRTARS